VIGAGVPLMVDMNCPMDEAAATAFAHDCRNAAPLFLEEPVWPPEDFKASQRSD
jgi:L-alanine-DL-glutamate epimerase-like enolase superfamily enzyme